MASNSSENENINAIIAVINEKKPETVEILCRLVQERLQIEDRKILELIARLEGEGRIRLLSPSQPRSQSFAAYLITINSLWFWFGIIWSIMTVAFVYAVPEGLYPWIFIRYIMGAVFILWLPGYSLIKMLFPMTLPIKTLQKSLDIIERIALSVGLSLALVPIIGLLLNYTPWGIRLDSIVVGLLVSTMIFSTLGILREHNLARSDSNHLKTDQTALISSTSCK